MKPSCLVFSDGSYFLEVLRTWVNNVMCSWRSETNLTVCQCPLKYQHTTLSVFFQAFLSFTLLRFPPALPPSTLKLLSVPPSGTMSGKQFPYYIVAGCPLIFQWIFWIIFLCLIGVSLPSNKRNSAAKIAPTSSDLIRPVQHPAS